MDLRIAARFERRREAAARVAPLQLGVEGAARNARYPVARGHREGRGTARKRFVEARVEQGVGDPGVEPRRQQPLPGRLPARAARAAGVLVDGAAAACRVHHDLVARHGLEARERQALVVRDVSLQTGFDARAAAGLEGEGEPGAARAVSELGEGRRLEPAARARVEVQLRCDAVGESRDRAGVGEHRTAAVVGVGARDEVVARIEADARRAQAEGGACALGEAQVGLGEEVGALDAVVLVAAQRAHRAEVVDVAAPALLHGLVLQPGGERQRAAEPDAVADPGERHAAEGPVEVHHAARGGDAAPRKREELPHLAVAEEGAGAQPVAAAEPSLERHAGLLLADGLARVEGSRRRVGLARVRRSLVPRESERIPGLRLVERVQHQREARVAARFPFQLGVELLAVGLRVRAVAVGVKARPVGEGAERAGFAARLRADAPRAPGTGQCLARERRLPGAIGGEELDHAARGVAVEAGDRPAHDLDALRRGKVEVCRLSLSVGHGGGNAVRVQLHAADAESRARPEAADRELQVLGVVLAVLQDEPRHAAERLRQVDLRLALAKRVAADRVDGHRDVEAPALAAGGGDDDAFVGLLRCRAPCREQRAGRQHGRAERRSTTRGGWIRIRGGRHVWFGIAVRRAASPVSGSA